MGRYDAGNSESSDSTSHADETDILSWENAFSERDSLVRYFVIRDWKIATPYERTRNDKTVPHLLIDNPPVEFNIAWCRDVEGYHEGWDTGKCAVCSIFTAYL